jgi:hypothetical protein
MDLMKKKTPLENCFVKFVLKKITISKIKNKIMIYKLMNLINSLMTSQIKIINLKSFLNLLDLDFLKNESLSKKSRRER